MFTKEQEIMWQETVKRNAESMGQSSIFAQIWNPDGEHEALYCMQLGLAIMMNKPVHLLVPKGRELPENMRRLARSIVEFDGKEDMERATALLVQRAGLDFPNNETGDLAYEKRYAHCSKESNSDLEEKYGFPDLQYVNYEVETLVEINKKTGANRVVGCNGEMLSGTKYKIGPKGELDVI